MRFANWMAKDGAIAVINAQPNIDFQVAHNDLSFMTNEEFSAMLLPSSLAIKIDKVSGGKKKSGSVVAKPGPTGTTCGPTKLNDYGPLMTDKNLDWCT